MNGNDLLEEIQRRIMKAKGTKSVTDAVLAKYLGVTQPQLGNYRDRDLTPKQIVNLMEKFSKRSEGALVDGAVIPIIEFFKIAPCKTKTGKKWELFSELSEDGEVHHYLGGIKASLRDAHGIYVFHDSRGQAIYAGKAQRQSLWNEMNNAFNRDRKEVQNIKRISHPQSRVKFDEAKERSRQIAKAPVPLFEMAAYCSAYRVPNEMISKFEALIVRAFANDLLNVRMEKF